MKGLFIVFHGFAAHNGISKKIFYQCDALRRCGAELRLCSLEVGADGSHRRILDGETLENFGHGLRAKLKKRFSYRSVTDYIRREGVRFLYVRFDHNANPALIRWFAHLKKLGVRIVMEIPTFPYDPEYARASRKTKLVLSVDKCFRNALARQVDRIVTFSQYDTIFARPTIRISNGIDFAHIPLKTNVNDTSNTVHLLGVADIHFWHGFDRVVAGLADYYRRPHEKEVIFHIVGGGSRFTVPELREQVREQGMEERVVLHGPLWGEALDRAFEEADLGIASLGRHRNGITHIKTLKNREYAARGIPFVYSENDSDFDAMPYVLKAPADESPIDIDALLHFLDGVDRDPAHIRASIEDTLSWDVQMRKVLDQIERLE